MMPTNVRTLVGGKPGTEETYIPRSFDQHLSAMPIRVCYRVPSERDVRKIQAFGDKLDVITEDGVTRVVTSSADHVDRQAHAIEAMVTAVHNYVGRAGPILTGHDLAEHGETEIVSEVYSVLVGLIALTDDERGKSQGSPDSLCLEIPAPAEIARNVASER